MVGRHITIEVCVDSVDSAISAVRAGADRLELCGNLGLGGGTTPSLGLLKSVQAAVPGVPIMAMVRPRTGDFLYSDSEIRVMLEDIRVFKEHGVSGVVFGILKSDGTIDVARTRMLVSEAVPLEVCFHRAFDLTADADEALRKVSSIHGITRVLTSGHAQKAHTAVPQLASHLQNASRLAQHEGRPPVSILPGSGVNDSTVHILLTELYAHGLQEIHLSGGAWEDGQMDYRPPGFDMGVGPGEWGVWKVREDTVGSVRRAVDGYDPE
ncbi:hypothetical protein PLICRDRAFT_171335 [Plicaturopsis crispa FD-325 SS-3]|nr:hypothetical protein PLICRDRAFT_171335 [Plicaturopsis crispa FD-325 SS-3]